MELSDILGQCGTLKIVEKRSSSNEYCEIVLLRKDDDKINSIFIGALGPAVKPKGAKPTRQDKELTAKFGGIMEGQTLFKADAGDKKIIAMFWPWQDGVNVTLKMAVIR